MARRPTANISLTPELEAFISSRVASGRYQSASEVVREALRLLEQREQQRIASLEELRREVAVGLAQARAGELVDGPAAMRRIRDRLARPAASSRRRAG